MASVSVGGVELPLKWVSLVVLVVQNTMLVLLMRYSRTSAGPEGLYLTSTAVVSAEFVKLAISLAAVINERGANAGAIITQELRHFDTLKLGVPGLLYTVQNNLLFVALSNLPAAVYQVTYQLKIITTAIMSVLLLQKRLNRYQIVALLLLTVGVAMVQVSTSSSSSSEKSAGLDQSATFGVTCVLLACITSGFAGVYMEKVLKGSRKVSLFMRNIQLSLFGIVLGLLNVYTNDLTKVTQGGFFQGYNRAVIGVVLLQAGGGLMIAVVMKYADNILKGFATSISIILSTWLSMFLFQFQLSILFVAGAGIVIGAVFLYGKPAPSKNGKYTPLPVSKK